MSAVDQNYVQSGWGNGKFGEGYSRMKGYIDGNASLDLLLNKVLNILPGTDKVKRNLVIHTYGLFSFNFERMSQVSPAYLPFTATLVLDLS